MSNNPLIFERTFNAPADVVWKAITDKEQMKQWYFDLPEFKPEVGCEFTFTGGPEEGRQYLHVCKITEVVRNKKLTYSWRYDGYDGISYLTFELFAEGKKTRLKLTHAGLESFPKSNKDFAKENFTEGWTYFMDKALPEFLEKVSV